MADYASTHPLVKALYGYIGAYGNVWVREKNLFSALGTIPSEAEIKTLEDKGFIKRVCMKDTLPNNDSREVYYTTPGMDRLEAAAAYDAIRILSTNTWDPVSSKDMDALIDVVEAEISKENGKKFALHPQQRAAVKCMANNSLCVITGGPGTGKTCTLQVAVRVMEKLHFGIDIRFTAPTGKAASRITESTGRAAKTWQRELHITYTKKKPSYFTGNVMVIDEVSMLDMEAASMVFLAIQNGQHLILVGDTEQLPSVGPGAVLRDLLDAEDSLTGKKIIPQVMLTHTYRQANDSALFANIQLIREGNPDLKSDGKEFNAIETTKEDNPPEQLLDLFKKEYDDWGADNVVCLLPYRRRGFCSNDMNNRIQAKVNPPFAGKKTLRAKLDDGSDVAYVIGDPVLQLKNRSEVVNGDVGKVEDIDEENGVLIVRYPECTVKYSRSELAAQLSLAYAMSVSKSQGSEYKCVLMALTTDHPRMFNRNIIYTGVTRAKQKCVLLYEKKALEAALENQAMMRRKLEGDDDRTTMFVEKIKFYDKKFALAAA